MDSDPAVLIVIALAVFRVSRLVVEDSITEPLRDWTLARVPDRIGELIECIWCVSFWIALAATVAYALSPSVMFWVCFPFALSAISGILASIR